VSKRTIQFGSRNSQIGLFLKQRSRRPNKTAAILSREDDRVLLTVLSQDLNGSADLLI
jgi:hypothetical protein